MFERKVVYTLGEKCKARKFALSLRESLLNALEWQSLDSDMPCVVGDIRIGI